MFKVAICDNNCFYQKKIADLTLKALFDTVETSFTFFENGMLLIDAILNNRFMADLLLIDIELPQIDGIKTVQFIRQLGVDIDIIFVSEAVEYGLAGYQYGAFDFVEKPISVIGFEKVLHRYAKEKIQRNPSYLEVAIRGCFCKINLKKVLYFESSGRKISAIEQDEVTTFYQKMDDLEEQMRMHKFLRIHQSYLINKNYVSFINTSEVVLINGVHLPVSRRYAADARDAFRISS